MYYYYPHFINGKTEAQVKGLAEITKVARGRAGI